MLLELDGLKKGAADASVLGKLVVAKQPFPKPIKKGTTVSGADGEHEEPTLVRFLTGAKSLYIPESKVRAEVVSEDSRKGEDAFFAGERPLDEDGFATFYDMKFAKPTRLNTAHLYFSVKVQFVMDDKTTSTVLVTSSPSEPFVVITNESQWGDSEGLLLRMSAFQDRETITWEFMANVLQTHFLRSTRQDLADPERPLSLNDLNYLARTQFNNRRVLNKTDLEEFWKWFGLACRRIRHQIPFHTLWMKGLVFGFITRKETEELLRDEPCGVFIVRFSESNAGKVVVSYVKHNDTLKVNEVTHFLLAYGPREAPKHLQNILSRKMV